MELPPPPPGLDIYEDRSGKVIASVLAPAILAVIAVGLRAWARYISKVEFRWDDYLIILALVGLQALHLVDVVKTTKPFSQVLSSANCATNILSKEYTILSSTKQLTGSFNYSGKARWNGQAYMAPRYQHGSDVPGQFKRAINPGFSK